MLADIVRRLDVNEVVARMIERFRSEISGYQRLPEPVLQGEIFEIARRNVELFLRSVTAGHVPTADEMQPFRDSARRRATEGMPLEDLLHAYRLGARLAWIAIEDATRPEERTALLLGVELVMQYVDQVTAAVAQTYLDERQHLVSETERQLRVLFETLVDNAVVDPDLRELAERHGFPITRTYRPFAYMVLDAPAHEHSEIAAAMRGAGVLALTEGIRVTGLVPETGPAPPLDDPRALRAAGEPVSRADLPEVVEELRLLLDIGRRRGVTGDISAEDYLPELLLFRSPRLVTLLERRTLGPLQDYAERRSSELLGTLEAFVYSALDRRTTSERLHVHPNTLDYRLKRIEALTGLSLGDPRDMLLVTLALKHRALTQDAEGEV
jgi:hypothetical protein